MQSIAPFLVNATTVYPAGSLKLASGIATAAAQGHLVATTEQLRLGYDASNYAAFTVSATGALTVAPSGEHFTVKAPSSSYGLLLKNSGGSDVFQVLSDGVATWGQTTTTAAGRLTWDTGKAIIHPTGTATTLQLSNSAGTMGLYVQTAGIGVGNNVTSPSAAIHAIHTTEQLRLGYDASNYAAFTVSSAGNLRFEPSGGSVGIWTDPATAFHVLGTLTVGKAGAISANDEFGRISFYSSDISAGASGERGYIAIFDDSGNAWNGNAAWEDTRIEFHTFLNRVTDNTAMLINSAANVGIGTGATISARLHSLATTEQLRLGYDASNYASFTVSSAGNLGIVPSGTGVLIGGTGTPGRMLEVVHASNPQLRLSKTVGVVYTDILVSSDMLFQISAPNLIGSANRQSGFDFHVEVSGTNSHNSIGRGLQGGYFSVVSLGTVTNFSGVYAIPQFNSTGTCTAAAGFKAYSVYNYDAGATVTSAACFHGLGLGNVTPGTFPNHYGLLLDAITGATNNYGIYQTGTAKNYFGGNVGIGIASGDGTLHVYTGSAGAVTANANADDVVIESNGTYNGLSFLSTANSVEQSIFFGSAGDNDAGAITYLHTTGGVSDHMAFRVAQDSEILLYLELNMVGVNEASPDGARLNVTSDTSYDCLRLKHTQTGGAFVNFVATNAASTANPLSTWTTGNSVQGHFRIEVNGTDYWVPYYNAPTS